MKPIKAHIYKALPHGCQVETCDNSGAKIIKIISVKGAKTVKGRSPSAGVGDLIFASVVKGTTQMRKQVVPAVIVRQKKEYRRSDNMRICFEDNAAVVLKDEKGTPKGTVIKGPVAKEATDRWTGISKIASIVV
jgi:large subunit ribosomal protein L14